MNRINWSLNNHFRCVSFLDPNLEGRLIYIYIYIDTHTLQNARERVEKHQNIKLENLIVYFLLMKTLLVKKIQFKKKNSKSNV
jgi:hypothetical protein